MGAIRHERGIRGADAGMSTHAGDANPAGPGEQPGRTPQSWSMRLGEILSPGLRRGTDGETEGTGAEGGGDAARGAAGDTGSAGSPHRAQPSCEAVMIVDDDTDWACECAFSLQVMGYEPIVALSASDALALYEEHDIGIALIDYEMPEQDGLTLARELSARADEHGRHLSIVMATGHATKDVAIGALRAHITDFLEKPVRQAELRATLQRIEGLRDTPGAQGAREALLDHMSSLSGELHRLAQLFNDPAAPGAADPAKRAPDDAAGARPATTARAPAPAGTGAVTELALTAYIRDLLRKETKRRDIGGGELFGDPAWAMLLDLLLSGIEHRRVSVSSACIASGAPMSTALRLVRRLVAENVLERLPDEHDRRRHFLAINPAIEVPLRAYLTEQCARGEG